LSVCKLAFSDSSTDCNIMCWLKVSDIVTEIKGWKVKDQKVWVILQEWKTVHAKTAN